MPDKLKVKLKCAMCNALVALIDEYLEYSYATMDDKLVIAGMAEIKITLMKKLIEYKKEYSMRLTPVQAIALTLFYDGFISEYKTDVGNKLHLITNEIKQKFY